MLLTTLEPENRLVARSLEREWNEKLAAIETLGREYVAWGQQVILPFSAEDRRRILELAQDLPMVWRSPTTTNSTDAPGKNHYHRYSLADRSADGLRHSPPPQVMGSTPN